MVSWTIILWSVGLIGAALIVISALRGSRINQDLLCRQCRFNLTGHPQTPVVCPECGGDLTRRRATLRGERSPVYVIAAIGFVALSVITLALTINIVVLLRPSNPALAGLTKDQLITMLEDSSRPNEQTLAATALTSAIGGNILDTSDGQRMFAVINEMSIDALNQQTAFADLLIALSQANVLSSDQVFGLIEEIAEIDMHLSTFAWPGYLTLVADLKPQRPEWQSLFDRFCGGQIVITQVAIDGHVIDEKMMLGFHDCPLGTRRFTVRNRKLIDTSEFSEGSYPLVISVQIDRVIDRRVGWDRSTNIATRRMQMNKTIEIHDALPAPVMVPMDEQLEQSLQAATSVSVTSQRNKWVIDLAIDQELLKIGLSGEAVLRMPDDRLIYLGRLQAIPSRNDGDGSRTKYRYRQSNRNINLQDELGGGHAQIEFIPWIDHPMFRHAQAAEEPLQMLGEPAVLSVMSPDDLSKGQQP